MATHDLIFSNTILQRLKRHLLFWLVFAIHIFIFHFYVVDMKYLSYATTYLLRLQDLLLFLPVSVFAAYFAIYFLLPRYILAEKYGKLFLVILLISLFLLLLSYLLSDLFNIRLAWDLPLNRALLIRKADFTLNNGLVYPLTVSGFAIGIKMTKRFYLQQKQNEKLATQKIDAEVQLSKSQVHPRFLFHSLNSIYKDMLLGAKNSPEMLLKLSDLLSYILYESDTLIPLEKELALLKNYINLEQIRWGKKLTITISEELKTNARSIEPLLLLPLIEYIFISADNSQPQHIHLNLQMNEVDNTFYFVAVGKWEETNSMLTEDVQIRQLPKRLQALYPGRHRFNIKSDADSITVSLSLQL